MVGKTGKIKPSVGVAEGMMMIGGNTMIKPKVGVTVGVEVGASVWVGVNTGVGGAAITDSPFGIHVAVVTLPAIQA
jgi:UDP-3-O-[3-hydroxymyristoyl] glucosamine N-acyltransferase